MKKKVLLAIGLIVLIVVIAVASYFWYIFFLDLGSDGTLSNKNKTPSSLILVDENKIYATFREGIEVLDDAPGYKFKVINNGVKTSKYRLKIIEIEPNKINDGCTPSTILKTSDLNYQLYLNNQIIKEGKLSELDNAYLDEQELNIDLTNNYELRIWVNSTATEFEGKHYHYKVDIEVDD